MKSRLSHVLHSKAKEHEDGKVFADWLNRKKKGTIYGDIKIELMIMGDEGVKMCTRLLKVSPQLLKRFLPDQANLNLLPVPTDKRGSATIPVGAARRFVTTHGSLKKLRHCAKCDDFLYARFKHQRFCCEKCQHSSYKSSPEWREHRRKYTRDLRASHKRKDEIALMRAKGTSTQ